MNFDIRSSWPEIALLLFFIGVFALVVLRLRRRRAFVVARVAPDAEVDLPHLKTLPPAVGATLRRVFRDPDQGLWVGVADIADGPKLSFCLLDYAARTASYESALRKPVELSIFALATLAPGGADAMRGQIQDADQVPITPDLVRLLPAPPPDNLANDYVVIGKVRGHRDDRWDDTPLTVYRVEVARGADGRAPTTLELAVRLAATELPYADGTMVHGTARLFGTLKEN